MIDYVNASSTSLFPRILFLPPSLNLCDFVSLYYYVYIFAISNKLCVLTDERDYKLSTLKTLFHFRESSPTAAFCLKSSSELGISPNSKAWLGFWSVALSTIVSLCRFCFYNLWCRVSSWFPALFQNTANCFTWYLGFPGRNSRFSIDLVQSLLLLSRASF